VIPQEFSHIACRQVDLDALAAIGDDQIAGLVTELSTPGTDRVVAYRQGRRWSACSSRRQWSPLARPAVAGAPEGVYLITGGLGGIGLVLADHLARTAKAKLVLTSRRGLPPRDTWQDYLASHGAQDAASRKIRSVIALEDLGAEVSIGSADVVDEAGMKAVVDEACARFGRIHGVIHAAGIAGGGMIQLKKPEVAAAVLAPKVLGTQVLERALAGSSSTSSCCARR